MPTFVFSKLYYIIGGTFILSHFFLPEVEGFKSNGVRIGSYRSHGLNLECMYDVGEDEKVVDVFWKYNGLPFYHYEWNRLTEKVGQGKKYNQIGYTVLAPSNGRVNATATELDLVFNPGSPFGTSGYFCCEVEVRKDQGYTSFLQCAYARYSIDQTGVSSVTFSGAAVKRLKLSIGLTTVFLGLWQQFKLT